MGSRTTEASQGREYMAKTVRVTVAPELLVWDLSPDAGQERSELIPPWGGNAPCARETTTSPVSARDQTQDFTNVIR
jgi:hypothetical protein